jgi:glycosyltransferase involved in cell wall biosynthesis
MLRNRLYYSLKPFLPWSLRVALRRWRAHRRRRRYADTWPIDESAARPPEGWQGWPEGKQFAVVLTHDVEGQLGVDRCRLLMELEEQLGFRSSFNFIPEGEYRVAAELRAELAERGFEVGVHDLAHDGKLLSSREGFRARARRINAYLKDWGAVGFRAGFMLHNLDWFHDLEVQYDASTFDTDPFEPQPDAVGTIFPFWVPRPRSATGDPHDSSIQRFTRHSAARPPQDSALRNPPSAFGDGYVELPYTLPQDFTTFIVFRERTIDLWKRKLDWVAAHGGMVLVNVHPDYLAFDGQPPTAREFPAELYAQLLRYLKEAYSGRYWHALPKEVAAHCAQFRPRHNAMVRKHVCMVCYSFYESDGRVMRYAEALRQRGDTVEAIALQRGHLPSQEDLNGVRVLRIQKRTHNERGKWDYLARLVCFLVRASLVLARRHFRHSYDLVHVHNIPDFLVFTAWAPKLFGARIILDIHDIVPEFFANKFKAAPDSLFCRALRLVERASMSFADHIIISNHLWYDKVIRRSAPARKCSVSVNHVDRTIFYPRPPAQKNANFRIVFPGGLQWHQGLDIAIRAFALFIKEVPSAELHIVGDGPMKQFLLELTNQLGLSEKVRFFGEVPFHKVPEIIAEADLGVVPKRADSFGNEAYSTKIMEFMSMGVPVVAARTKIDSYYFNDTQVRFFTPGDENDMARAMVDIARQPALRQKLIQNGLAYAERNQWETKKQEYLDLVDALVARQPHGNKGCVYEPDAQKELPVSGSEKTERRPTLSASASASTCSTDDQAE